MTFATHRPYVRSCMLAALLLVIGACARIDPQATAELRGAWQTTATRYAARGFEISSDSITLAVGYGARRTFAIHSIERTTEHGRILYTIRYDGVATVYDFPFYFDPAESTIRMRGQPDVVWRRRI